MIFDKIVNINSEIAVSDELWSDKNSLFDLFKYYEYFSDNTKIANIPVFLVNEETMKKNERDIKTYYDYDNIVDDNVVNKDYADFHDRKKIVEKGFYNPPTEWLGVYLRRTDDLFEDSPVIIICPERIAKIVRSKEEFIILFSMVVVHEFAHAQMDQNGENKQYGKEDDFFYWMEESLANFLTVDFFLLYFDDERHGTKVLRPRVRIGRSRLPRKYEIFVRDFVNLQPSNYAFGGNLFFNSFRGFYAVIEQWPIYKKYLGSGNKDKVTEKAAWLAYVRKHSLNPDYDILKKLYYDLFE